MTFSPRMFARRASLVALFGLTALGAASCGEVARTGQSPAFLIIDSLEAASGADPAVFSTTLLSDVETLIETTINGNQVRVPTIFNDAGRVQFRLAIKNPGTPGSPLSPSTLNEITVTRYRVAFRRSDGRNTPGVDVPYSFDGGFTVTVSGSGSASASFDLVRHQAKEEPPLKNLARGGAAIFISTIADITFFGRDQAGNEVSVSGSISVNFADFADPR